ncbi:hypothetical protein ACRAKI_34675 [Saccharothrix isguenensis]
MAVSDAVRRSGSVLLRALAVGGLATAAWLACGGLASADEDHSDEIAATLDAVNVALGEQQSATVDALLADPLPHDPFGLPAFDASDTSGGFGTSGTFSAFAVDFSPVDRPLERPLVADRLPFEFLVPSSLDVRPTDDAHSDEPYSAPYTGARPADPYDDEYEYTHPGYTSGSSTHYSHSGAVSNTMPAPLYQAKVAAKAAARAAASAPPPAPVPAAPPVPAAVVVTAPAGSDVLPQGTASAPPASRTASNADVVWEAPKPSTPAPAPTQAPAPSAPTASSSSSADSGGGHRGGLIASFSSQSDPKPLAAWSTERWDDGRSPGSVPGLPSTSPD